MQTISHNIHFKRTAQTKKKKINEKEEGKRIKDKEDNKKDETGIQSAKIKAAKS